MRNDLNEKKKELNGMNFVFRNAVISHLNDDSFLYDIVHTEESEKSHIISSFWLFAFFTMMHFPGHTL